MLSYLTCSVRLRTVALLTLLAATLTLSGQLPESLAQGAKNSAGKVKVQVNATKADAAGNQQITLKLTIEKDWYIYANPVGNDDFKGNETVVKVTGPTPPLEVKTNYPAGKLHADAGISYKVYEGEVTLTTVVRRAAGDTAPLQVTINVHSCNQVSKICLLPGEIKLSVPAVPQ